MLYTDEQARALIKETRLHYPSATLNKDALLVRLMAALSERLPKKTKKVREVTWGVLGQSGPLPVLEVAGYVHGLVTRGMSVTDIRVSSEYEVPDDE